MIRMSRDPSILALWATGAAALVLAGGGFAIAAGIWLSTALAPDFFPGRWLAIVGGGVLSATIAAAAFVTGLRLHDTGDRSGALRAFYFALSVVPLLIAGASYFGTWT